MKYIIVGLTLIGPLHGILAQLLKCKISALIFRHTSPVVSDIWKLHAHFTGTLIEVDHEILGSHKCDLESVFDH